MEMQLITTARVWTPTQRAADTKRTEFHNDIALGAAMLEMRKRKGQLEFIFQTPKGKLILCPLTKTPLEPVPDVSAVNEKDGTQLELKLGPQKLPALPLPKDTALSREEEKRTPLTVAKILRVTAYHFNMSLREILKEGRAIKYVLPRQVSMYLSKVLLNKSLPEIGRRHGGRDHTTVLSGVRKIARLVGDTLITQAAGVSIGTIDEDLAAKVREIRYELTGQASV